MSSVVSLVDGKHCRHVWTEAVHCDLLPFSFLLNRTIHVRISKYAPNYSLLSFICLQSILSPKPATLALQSQSLVVLTQEEACKQIDKSVFFVIKGSNSYA